VQLVKLELNGFKSFARKTELVFEPGITSIIGPNGSGKSNIADAVRWVLGEQSARTLRGTKMEDVIFNGSELRKPQSYCDVSLTFDNSDGMLPVDFNEVTVTRRVYRSGESEYLLNRNECRLKDILDLFRDTGIGKEGYSIISQGRVDDILSNKSTDRRAVLEEAAGIMRYRVRKEEAERKLSSTRDNITRIDDIIAEISSQLESLWSQSEVAKEYLKLRDELKSLELNVFIYQYERIRQRMGETEGTSEQLDVEAEQYAADERSIIEAITQAQAAADEFEQRISEQQRSLMELSTGAESRLGELKVFHERAANITAANEKLDEDALRFSNQLETLMQALEAAPRLSIQNRPSLPRFRFRLKRRRRRQKPRTRLSCAAKRRLKKKRRP
jgi:chromosome segregation protein